MMSAEFRENQRKNCRRSSDLTKSMTTDRQISVTCTISSAGCKP